MQKKTSELEKVLSNSKLKDYGKYIKDHQDDKVEPGESFVTYFKELLQEKNLTQLKVFLRADIPERYGYKILSGEQRTRQRDIILRLCYAADFTTEETQRFLWYPADELPERPGRGLPVYRGVHYQRLHSGDHGRFLLLQFQNYPGGRDHF